MGQKRQSTVNEKEEEMGLPETKVVEIDWISCARCGLVFGVPGSWSTSKRENHRLFHCPDGHPLSYHGKTEEEKLIQENKRLAQKSRLLKHSLDSTERSRRAQKGHMTRIKNRIAKGVCPCCNRQFKNLLDHMETKHPDWVDQ